MINKFKMTVNPESEKRIFPFSPFWKICHTGQDIMKGNEYSVTTSKLNYYTLGPRGDAELIAKLLNWYYTDMEAAEKEINNKGDKQ